MKPKYYFAVVVKGGWFINKFEPVRQVPALFQTKRQAESYVAEMSAHTPAFRNMVRVERVEVRNA